MKPLSRPSRSFSISKSMEALPQAHRGLLSLAPALRTCSSPKKEGEGSPSFLHWRAGLTWPLPAWADPLVPNRRGPRPDAGRSRKDSSRGPGSQHHPGRGEGLGRVVEAAASATGSGTGLEVALAAALPTTLSPKSVAVIGESTQQEPRLWEKRGAPRGGLDRACSHAVSATSPPWGPAPLA